MRLRTAGRSAACTTGRAGTLSTSRWAPTSRSTARAARGASWRMFAAGKGVDDIARDHVESGGLHQRVLRHERVHAGRLRCRSASTATCRRAPSAGRRQAKTDISVSRSFRFPGRGVRLQFRGELFNAFNQVNFNAPTRDRQLCELRPHSDAPMPRASGRSR